jgi:hypothetical protein
LLFMRMRVDGDTIGKRDVAEFVILLHPRLFSLTAAGCHMTLEGLKFSTKAGYRKAYSARHDGRGLRHALSFLVVIRIIRLVFLQS